MEQWLDHNISTLRSGWELDLKAFKFRARKEKVSPVRQPRSFFSLLSLYLLSFPELTKLASLKGK